MLKVAYQSLKPKQHKYFSTQNANASYFALQLCKLHILVRMTKGMHWTSLCLNLEENSWPKETKVWKIWRLSTYFLLLKANRDLSLPLVLLLLYIPCLSHLSPQSFFLKIVIISLFTRPITRTGKWKKINREKRKRMFPFKEKCSGWPRSEQWATKKIKEAVILVIHIKQRSSSLDHSYNLTKGWFSCTI